MTSTALKPGMLSPHFSIAELTYSPTAQRKGIRNIPDVHAFMRLRRVCETILEPVRAHFGGPVHINSGYRSPALNKSIPGSSKHSQHMLGEAVDFEVYGYSNKEVARWIAGGGLEAGFGQVILEFYNPRIAGSGWVHCSLPTPTIHGDVLTITRIGGQSRTWQGIKK